MNRLFNRYIISGILFYVIGGILMILLMLIMDDSVVFENGSQGILETLPWALVMVVSFPFLAFSALVSGMQNLILSGAVGEAIFLLSMYCFAMGTPVKKVTSFK